MLRIAIPLAPRYHSEARTIDEAVEQRNENCLNLSNGSVNRYWK